MTAPDQTARRTGSAGTSGATGFAALSVIGSSSQQVTGLIITILAARYLAPQDYGLYMLAVVFAELGLIFSYSGVFHYLVTSPRSDVDIISSLFWIHLSIGTLSGAVLFGAAAPLATIFANPELAPILMIFAALQPFAAIIGWATGCLHRAQRMRRYFLNLLISNGAGLSVSVTAFILDPSLYALVAFRVARLIAALFLFLPTMTQRPRFCVDPAILRESLAYARALYGTRLISFFAAYGTDLMLAFCFTTAESGLYRFANRLAQAAIDVIALPIRTLALKSFAQAARHSLSLILLIRDYICVSAFLMSGVAITQISLGHTAITTLFGPDYVIALWAFYALSVRYAVGFASQLIEPIMAARQTTSKALRFHAIWTFFALLGTVLTAPFGLGVLALTQALLALLCTLHALRILHSQSLLTFSDIRGSLRPIAMSLAIYATALTLCQTWLTNRQLPPDLALPSGLCIALVLSALLCLWAHKRNLISFHMFASN